MKRTAIILLFITRYSFAQVDSEFISEKLIERLNESKYYALVIGNNDYPNPGIPNLENPISDASNLINVLTSKYSFESPNIVFLQNATRIDIIEHFDLFARKVTPKDNFLLFYAGHGKWDSDIEQGYWLPVNAKAESSANWISNSDIRDNIKKVKSKHTILISDACFSGGIFRGREVANVRAMLELYNAPSRRAITSGALNTVPDKSVFMRYLIKKLNENDKILISADQLFNSFKMIVIDNSPRGQKPQYGVIGEAGDEGGDFIFLRKNKLNIKTETSEIKKGGINTDTENRTDEDPILITGKVRVDYGSIRIDTQIDGELYLDGKKLGNLQANTENLLNNISAGTHILKIEGSETQTREIIVYKDGMTTVNFKKEKEDYTSVEVSSFTDSRDRKTYNSVHIGNLEWMAENLDYRMSGSFVNKKGYRLYNWKAAMKACPAGWHLPSDKEWDLLVNHFGGATKAGAALKSKDGWNDGGNGTNSSGFTALPTGYRFGRGPIAPSAEIGKGGYFWSSTEEDKESAWLRLLNYNNSEVSHNTVIKLLALSCRCVRD